MKKINKKCIVLLLSGAISVFAMSGCMLSTFEETQETEEPTYSESYDLDEELDKIRYGVDDETIVDTKYFGIGEHVVIQRCFSYDSEIRLEDNSIQYALNVPTGYQLFDSSFYRSGAKYASPVYVYVFVNDEEVVANGYYDYTNNIIVYPKFGTPTSLDLEPDYQKTK